MWKYITAVNSERHLIHISLLRGFVPYRNWSSVSCGTRNVSTIPLVSPGKVRGIKEVGGVTIERHNHSLGVESSLLQDDYTVAETDMCQPEWIMRAPGLGKYNDQVQLRMRRGQPSYTKRKSTRPCPRDESAKMEFVDISVSDAESDAGIKDRCVTPTIKELIVSPQKVLDWTMANDLYRQTFEENSSAFHPEDDFNLAKLLLTYDYVDEIDWVDVTRKLNEMSPNGPFKTKILVMRRWKFSLRPGVKYGRWSAEEDARLRNLVGRQQEKRDSKTIAWSDVAQRMETRTLKQCRERWSCTLDPSVKHGAYTKEEDDIILDAVERAKNLPNDRGFWTKLGAKMGRTYLSCKHRYDRTLNPSLSKGKWTEEEVEKFKNLLNEHGKSWTVIARYMGTRQAKQCQSFYQSRGLGLKTMETKHWTEEETMKLARTVAKYKCSPRGTWTRVAEDFGNRTGIQCRERWEHIFEHLERHASDSGNDPDVNLEKTAPKEDLDYYVDVMTKKVQMFNKLSAIKKTVTEVNNMAMRKTREQTIIDKLELRAKKKDRKSALDAYVKELAQTISKVQVAIRKMDIKHRKMYYSARPKKEISSEERARIIANDVVENILKFQEKKKQSAERKAARPKSAKLQAARKADEKNMRRMEFQVQKLSERLDESISTNDDEKTYYFYFARAMIYEKMKNHNEALADYRHATVIRPNDARPFFSRAIVQLRLRQKEEAFSELNAALLLNPDAQTIKEAQQSFMAELQ
eukprot:CFRG5412T1